MARRVAIAYAVVSVVALIVGFTLGETGAIRYTIVWIVLGPLISLYYAAQGWFFAVFFYLMGSVLLIPCLMLILHRRRINRLMGYSAAVIAWAITGLVAFAAAWGA
jgi:hypothetical protein